jgi:hypothetical protein
VRRWVSTIPYVIVSLLIAASGMWAGQALKQVDHDLRIIYAEYTIAATDLGHMNARLIRYRTTILRAIEADSRGQFESIAPSFVAQKERIEATLDRYRKASEKASSRPEVKAREAAMLKDLQEKVTQYIEASHHTLDLLVARWRAASAGDARRLRDQAEQYAAEHAGPKLIAVSYALDHLLETVVEIAGDARNEAKSILRGVTTIVISVSFALALIVLALPAARR